MTFRFGLLSNHVVHRSQRSWAEKHIAALSTDISGYVTKKVQLALPSVNVFDLALLYSAFAEGTHSHCEILLRQSYHSSGLGLAARSLSDYQRQLLQGPDVVGGRCGVAHARVRDLADVDALVAVDADAVWGDELTNVQSVAAAEPFEHAA